MRAFDFLFLLLVIAPIASGGLWIREKGLHLEYTQPGPAAAFLALWLWVALRKGRSPSEFFRNRQKIFSWWTRAVNENHALFICFLGVSLWWWLASLARHVNFQSNAIDLGIFTNAIWNLVQTGSPHSSIKGGISLLADHQNFVIYPIALIFSLIPRVETLLFIQAAALASVGLAIFYLAKQRIKSDLTYLLPLAYWSFAPVRAAIVFDFHPEVLMLPLFLFGVLGLQSKNGIKQIIGALLFIGGILAKESGGPVAVGLGLAWIAGAGPTETRRFTRIVGALAIFLGLLAFWFDTKYLPQALGAKYIYQGTYEPFGSSVLDLVKAPFLYPVEFFRRLFGFARLKFFVAMVLPFAFLPLFSWRALLASAPGFFMLFLTSTDQRVSLGYHYAIEPAVGVLFALSAAIASPFVIKHQKKFLYAVPLLALIAMGRSESYQIRIYSSSPQMQWLRAEILPNLNPEAAIAASSEVVPHIASRRWVHYLPIIWIEGISEEKFVDCVLWERSVKNSYLEAEHEPLMRERLSTRFEEEKVCGSMHLYRNKAYSQRCLVKEVSCPSI